MDRLEQLRQVIDDIVRRNPDMEESRCGFVHLYGVSTLCTLLALKRGLDPELCSITGMLHDIWSYKVGDSPDHGQLGAEESEKILNSLGSYSPEEIKLICTAITRHTDKESIDGKMDELLKDADVFQHYLYHPTQYAESLSPQLANSSEAKPMRLQRLERVLVELGLNSSI